MIRRLLDKEIIIQEKRDVYYYYPVLGRNEYIQRETRSFVDKFFSGSSRNLAAALVSSDQLTKEEIEELRDFFHQNI